jgi:hypothetical protein
MYVGCNGATCIYACCIAVQACICGKIIFFISGNCKKVLQVFIGKWKRPSEQVAWGEENIAITTKYACSFVAQGLPRAPL